MGASFPTRDIPVEHHDSATIPPVENGIDPRPAYINICNDTNGAKYRLRIWATVGDKSFYPIGTETVAGNAGFVTLDSGGRASIPLPKNTACVSVGRASTAADGSTPPYAGPLTYCIERGALLAPKGVAGQ